MAQDKEMSFLDHLEELRGHLLRGIGAIVVFTIIAFIAKDIVFGVVIFGPAKADFITYRLLCQATSWIGLDGWGFCFDKMPFTLQSRTMTGQFSMHMLASLILGLVIGFPYFFWEMWRFISPGLHLKERTVSRYATLYVSVLFAIGVSFGYFILSPLAVFFLATYQIDVTIVNEFDITSYVSTLAMMVLACGLMFQLPMVVFFLSRIGLINPTMMRAYRRYSVVGIFVVAAVITPPDPISQILVAIPLTVLYEVSIFVSARAASLYRKDRQTALED